MAELWPSTPDTSAAEQPDPRVVGLDDDEADDLLSTLSSGTARRVLTELHDEPATPSALADRVDTSLQNVQYHLGNLSEAEMIEVIDTIYSEKGREMKVYAPADRPLVMFASPERERPGLKATLLKLLGGFGLLALGSVVVQALLEGIGSVLPFGTAASGDGGGAALGGQGGAADGGGVSVQTVETVEQAGAAAGLPPGLVFFLGGAVVLLGVTAVWYVQRRR